MDQSTTQNATAISQNGTAPSPVENGATQLTAEIVNKLILEQIDRDKKWLEFAQNQGKNDREYSQHLFNRTYWFIAAIVAVVGIAGTVLGVRSIQQIRDEAKLTVDGEVAKVQAELDRTKREIDDSATKTKKSVQDELNSAHTEVARRVDAEFRTDQITSLVQSVAKQKEPNKS